MRLIYLVYIVCFLFSVGCGSDAESEENNASQNNSSQNNSNQNNASQNNGNQNNNNQNTQSLTCTSGAYCTSWFIVGTQVDALPEATGGTIESGTYVLSDALAVETAWNNELNTLLVIKDNEFRNTTNDDVGTFSTDGNLITFDQTEACANTGESFGTRESQYAVEYVVDGDSLILFGEGLFQNEPIRVGLVYTKETGDLCDVSGSVTCELGDNCFCAFSLDSELEDAQCGG